MGAAATTAPDTAISAVSASSRVFRFIALATVEIDRLAATANTPEIAIPCPAIPSVT
ncbi:hypothetical protein D9M69_665580 [compost metagenome]